MRNDSSSGRHREKFKGFVRPNDEKPPLHHGGSARRHRWLRHSLEARALHLQQRVGRGEGLLAPAFPLPAVMSESDVTAALLSRSPR
ncbi:hypothetical protein ACOMHN_019042 [Nucella lapillus]